MQVGPQEPQIQSEPQSEIDSENAGATHAQPHSELADGSNAQQPTLLERAQDNPLLPSLLLVGGIMLMIFILFRSLRKNHAARASRDHATGTPSERIAEIHQRAQSSTTAADKAMLDAEEITRRLSAQLDNKAARIELLLEEADAKLDELNRTLAGAERSPSRTTQTRTPDPLYSATPSEQHPTAQRTIDPSLLDRARIDQDRADRVGTQEAQQALASTGSAQDQINERILTLADDGLGCVEIARSLNQPVGQVELVLNLRKSS